MKKIIKVVSLALAIASIGTGAFAQASKTSDSTADLFTTDVDKFMNVLTWQDVNPANAFITLNPNANGLDVGFAK